jgi:predicted glycosyltransferase
MSSQSYQRKILIDIIHPADINFFKNAIQILSNYNIKVELSLLPRNNVLNIANKEIRNVDKIIIGKYDKTLIGKIEQTISRSIILSSYINKNNIPVTVSFGSISLVYASLMQKIQSVTFDDDKEYKLAFIPYRYITNKLIVPKSLNINGKNVINYNGYKELSYLHPNYFTPNKDVLNEYNIEADSYVFIRITNITNNYKKTELSYKILTLIKYLRSLNLNIILSLENKDIEIELSKYCFILKEPVKDIYSLIYYASFSISTGDTMARESCILGTPSIFIGERYMTINKELEEKSILFNVSNFTQFKSIVLKIINHKYKDYTRSLINNYIKNQWNDTTKIIVSNVLDTVKK